MENRYDYQFTDLALSDIEDVLNYISIQLINKKTVKKQSFLYLNLWPFSFNKYLFIKIKIYGLILEYMSSIPGVNTEFPI